LGINGEVLLAAGVQMTAHYIKRMGDLGIAGAYVDDPLSEDLEVIGAMSDELRSSAVRRIASTYSKAAKNQSDMQASGKEIYKLAEKILDEILGHGDVMLNMFDMKTYDSYTFFHCVNVAVISIVMGIALDFGRQRLLDLAYSALLHDIGKVLIDAKIINKRGPLTEEEFEIVKRHPKDGYDYVKKNFSKSMNETIALGILHHHERVSGCGYPAGKIENEISLYAKILAIADVYDALISDRPYRKGVFPVEAMEYVQGNCGTFFDFDLVQIFTRKVALFPVGTSVLLSNGATALIMENYEGLTQRPLVRVFMEGNLAVKPYLIDLSKERYDITIIASIDA
jgi:HD-GYP domain-containing protein (c-di-GMP phosphodiesterase class II)